MSATPATVALDAAHVSYRLHAYDHDPDQTNFGAEAASALGISEEQMFKTLVVDIGTEGVDLAVAVLPVAFQLNLKLFAAVLGAKRAVLAGPARVARTTGYIVGGVSPLGQKMTLVTVVDETAQLWDTIFVSGGRRGLDVELAPDDLARLIGARFADIAR